MMAEAFDLRFGLRPQAFLGDVNFVLLSANAFPKSASVEEAQRINVLECLVADAQLN